MVRGRRNAGECRNPRNVAPFEASRAGAGVCNAKRYQAGTRAERRAAWPRGQRRHGDEGGHAREDRRGEQAGRPLPPLRPPPRRRSPRHHRPACNTRRCPNDHAMARLGASHVPSPPSRPPPPLEQEIANERGSGKSAKVLAAHSKALNETWDALNAWVRWDHRTTTTTADGAAPAPRSAGLAWRPPAPRHCASFSASPLRHFEPRPSPSSPLLASRSTRSCSSARACTFQCS